MMRWLNLEMEREAIMSEASTETNQQAAVDQPAAPAASEDAPAGRKRGYKKRNKLELLGVSVSDAINYVAELGLTGDLRAALVRAQEEVATLVASGFTPPATGKRPLVVGDAVQIGEKFRRNYPGVVHTGLKIIAAGDTFALETSKGVKLYNVPKSHMKRE